MNKNQLILETLKDIELSISTQTDVRSKYEVISNIVTERGHNINITPQGSFLIGTVVKPYKDLKDRDYDLDILCIFSSEYLSQDAGTVKNIIGDILKSYKTYNDILAPEDPICWTLKYSGTLKNSSFLMDLIPSVSRDDNFDSKTVRITNKNKDNSYNWTDSDPLGFADWFMDINNSYLTVESKIDQFNNFDYEVRALYNFQVEEVPSFYYKSNLQRAVQFIKRHRDIYYDRRALTKFKPSTFVITALIADSAKDAYGHTIDTIITNFIRMFLNNQISVQQGDKVLNPVDCDENIIEDWANDKKVHFEKWLVNMNTGILKTEDKDFKRFIHNDVNFNVFKNDFSSSTTVTPVKPWSDDK